MTGPRDVQRKRRNARRRQERYWRYVRDGAQPLVYPVSTAYTIPPCWYTRDGKVVTIYIGRKPDDAGAIPFTPTITQGQP